MSLEFIFHTQKWGCIVGDGRANAMRGGKLVIAGDGWVKFIMAGSVGLLAATGLAFDQDSCRAINGVNCEFDLAVLSTRAILTENLPDETDPEYRALLDAGFCRPGAVLLGRRGGAVCSEVLLTTAYSHVTGDFALHAIGSAEIVADELRDLALRIAHQNLGPASISLQLRNLILLASVRDFVRVSPCVIMREVLAAPALDEAPWRDGADRKIFFLSPRGFTCRRLPENIKAHFRAVDVVCVGTGGFHFGCGVVGTSSSIEDALGALAANNVMPLPPHASAEPVPVEIVEKLAAIAPDFGAVAGETTVSLLRKADAARGFAPLRLQ